MVVSLPPVRSHVRKRFRLFRELLLIPQAQGPHATLWGHIGLKRTERAGLETILRFWLQIIVVNTPWSSCLGHDYRDIDNSVREIVFLEVVLTLKTYLWVP